MRKYIVKRKKKLLLILLCLCLAGIATIFGINAYVKKLGGERIISSDKAAELENVDCILAAFRFFGGGRS